ncbi:hypothetical protein [Paenibacillus silvae]|uniref:Uncharacterized protein n=1 Tax=Paenibacillus silvae TaxID=1325358 RepID=A0A2W6NDL7_9BACL|nr:hypothetical protein [Paenibacillus silvae]PZT53825.1 hypothetical protein DN757_20460 [Paenibacillus silvae]
MTHESFNEQVRIVEQLQQKLRADHIEHFYITEPSKWQSGQLVLAGSFDFTYYHNVEITFTGVEFILCPGATFCMDHIRLATEEEIVQLHPLMYGYERNGIVFCLENEFEHQRFYIVAKQMTYHFGMVYYYDRANLQAGERIADFVKHRGRIQE